MREIKFRGRRVDNGEWIYGSLLDGDIIVAGQVDADGDYIGVGEWSSVDVETVGQYTGLQDRNGKEIYEGDILHWKCSKSGSDDVRNHVVTFGWRNHGYEITIHANGEKWATGRSYWNDSEREVIGNIYENPELLTAAE